MIVYVTVAVKPKIGVFGKFNLNVDKFVYDYLNYLPQVDTQWTSSITNFTKWFFSYKLWSILKNCALLLNFYGVKKITILSFPD